MTGNSKQRRTVKRAGDRTYYRKGFAEGFAACIVSYETMFYSLPTIKRILIEWCLKGVEPPEARSVTGIRASIDALESLSLTQRQAD